jgi:WD40 repeat protein
MIHRAGKIGLAAAFFALLALTLGSCAGLSTPEVNPTSPPAAATNTPSATPTLAHSPTASPTAAPTFTPEPEATPAPTLTPTLALPVSQRTPYPYRAGALAASDLAQVETLARYGGPQVRSIRLASDGRTLVIGTALGIEIYNAAERTLTNQFEVQVSSRVEDNLSLSRDARRMLVISPDGVHIFTHQGERVQTLPVAATFITDGVEYPTRASLSPDGSMAVAQTCGERETDCSFFVYRVEDNRLLFSGPSGLRSDTPRFTPDGAFVAADNRGNLRLWSLADWSQGQQIFLGTGARFTFSPDTSLVAIQRLQNVEIRSLEDRRMVRLITGFERGFEKTPQALFSPNGSALAVLTEKGQLTVWDLRRGSLVSSQSANHGELALFSLTDNGLLTRRALPNRPYSLVAPQVKQFEFASDNRSLNLAANPALDAPAQSCSIGYTGGLGCVAYPDQPVVDSSGNLYVASMNPSGSLLLLNQQLEALATIPVQGWKADVCWITAPDGYLTLSRSNPASPGNDRTELRLLGERRLIKTYFGATEVCTRSTDQRLGLLQVNLSTPTRQAASHHLVMNLVSGEIVHDQPSFMVADTLAITNGGAWAASALYLPDQAAVRLALHSLPGLALSEENSRVLLAAAGAEERVTALRFSPDGSLLAAGFANGKLVILAVDGSQLVEVPDAVWEAHADLITELAFSSDGALLATYGQDGFVQIFGIANRNP